jgi:hypothetical protein
VTARARWRTVSVETCLRVALWTVLLAVVAYTRTDPDLWGHVRFGLDILRDGMLQRADPYSFTSDREWVNHEWGAEVLSGAAFTVSGSAGLVGLKLLVIGAALLLINRALRRDGILTGRGRDWIVALTVITTVQQAHHVRPQIFSLLLFTLLLTSLLSSTQPKGRRWLLLIPLLFAVWANFHGGWIVGGGVLVLWVIGTAVGESSDRLRVAAVLLAVGVASLLATLANPYGLGLWRFLWETVGLSRADIVDWQPVYALDPSVWGLWILTATVATLGFVRGRRSLQLTRTIIVLTLGIGSFFVNRLLGFFALSTATLFGAALMGTTAAPAQPARIAVSGGGRLVAGAISSIMIIGGLIAIAIGVACIRIDPRTTPEAEAVNVLKGQRGGNRLLVWFDWGEYAIWHLAPSMRVSTDGRRETVYSASLQNRHLRFFFDAPGGADLVREIGADYVWIPAALPAARRLRANGWSVLYEGPTSVIFARPDLVPNSVMPMSTVPESRCFPAPVGGFAQGGAQ